MLVRSPLSNAILLVTYIIWPIFTNLMWWCIGIAEENWFIASWQSYFIRLRYASSQHTLFIINSISSHYSTCSVNCMQVLTQILARLVCVHVSGTRMKLMHVGITCVMQVHVKMKIHVWLLLSPCFKTERYHT